MNSAAQFEALRAWLLPITGLPAIIRAHPNAPRPQGRYGVLNLLSDERINWPHDITYAEDTAGATQIMHETREAAWSLNAYGEPASDALRGVQSASMSSASLLDLFPLVLNRTSQVRRLPELVGNRWEDRAQIDLFVRYQFRPEFAVDVVETVPFAYNGEAGSITPPVPAFSPEFSGEFA